VVVGAATIYNWLRRHLPRLLASPELVARTITAVRRENGAAEDTELEEGDVIEALGALEPVWDELYPAEQARIRGSWSSGSMSRPTASASRCMPRGFGASSQSELAQRLRPLSLATNPCWRRLSNGRTHEP